DGKGGRGRCKLDVARQWKRGNRAVAPSRRSGCRWGGIGRAGGRPLRSCGQGCPESGEVRAAGGPIGGGLPTPGGDRGATGPLTASGLDCVMGARVSGGIAPSSKEGGAVRVAFFHEDDYCQVEVLPAAAAGPCRSEMGRIDEFAEAHLDGMGFTDIY